MTTAAFKWMPAVFLALGLHAPSSFAQTSAATVERLHSEAMASFRQARFSEAYGRLMSLADAGHAPSAELALWMFQHGPEVFGKDWDSNPEQLAVWAQAAGQKTPDMAARVYPSSGAQKHSSSVAQVALRTRSSAP